MRHSCLLPLGLALALAACGGGAPPTPPVPPPPVTRPADVGSVLGPEVEATVPWDVTPRHLALSFDRFSEAERFSNCLAAPRNPLPVPEPVFRRFERPLSPAELERLAGAPAGSRLALTAAYHLATLGGAADPASLLLNYGVEWRTGREALDLGQATLGYAPGDPEFGARCGDAFVSERWLGDRMVVELKLRFGSAAARAEFLQAAGAAPAAWEVGPALAAMAQARLAQVRAELSILFLGSGSGTSVLQRPGFETGRACALGDPTACGIVLAHAATVAGDDDPMGLAASAARFQQPLALRLSPWTDVGGPGTSRLPAAEVASARASLDAAIRAHRAIGDRLETLDLFGLQGAPWTATRAAARENVAALSRAMAYCFIGTGPADASGVDWCLGSATPASLAADGFLPGLSLDALPAP